MATSSVFFVRIRINIYLFDGNLYKEQHKLCIAFSRHNCN